VNLSSTKTQRAAGRKLPNYIRKSPYKIKCFNTKWNTNKMNDCWQHNSDNVKKIVNEVFLPSNWHNILHFFTFYGRISRGNEYEWYEDRYKYRKNAHLVFSSLSKTAIQSSRCLTQITTQTRDKNRRCKEQGQYSRSFKFNPLLVIKFIANTLYLSVIGNKHLICN